MTEPIPIACYLTDTELQRRRQDHLDKLRLHLIGYEELRNGFDFRFRLEEGFLTDLAALIDLERQCCPFLNFKMGLESGKDFVSLELTGTEGTKEIIRSLFEWN